MLAGLPAETGLYASILPLVAYALLGTSRALSVGPVAVVSLMTATAVGQVAGDEGKIRLNTGVDVILADTFEEYKAYLNSIGIASQ